MLSPRSFLFTLLLASTIAIAPVFAANGAAVAHTEKAPDYILVGFVGGFVRHDNAHHGPVKLAEQMVRTFPGDAYVQVFENRHRKTAYRTIVRLLDRDHDGSLSSQEKDQARIILFGQSWGASAVVLLARDLRRAGVPVLLTVQVDSVPKLWQEDTVIPPNVAEAVNFYQPHGFVHGESKIVAADPSHTEILGNYRFDYKKEPVHCEGMSWADRYLTRGHMQSECDPRLWGEVEQIVRQQMKPQASTASVTPLP